MPKVAEKSKPKPQRDARGYFLPGTTGNPGGRSRDSYILQEAAKLHGPKAVDTLAELMADKSQTGAVRMGAAVALLDRGFGRPQVSIEAKVETTFDAGQAHLEALKWLAAGGCLSDYDAERSKVIDVTPNNNREH